MFRKVEILCGRKIPLVTLLASPTIEYLAKVMQGDSQEPRPHSLVALRETGARRPFFCVHANGGDVLAYYELARRMNPERPFYGLRARSLGDDSEPQETIEEMAAHYIASIRELYPAGPYLLGGASFGGIVAFEMARQLHADGSRVDALVLIDATLHSDHIKPFPLRIVDHVRIVCRLQPHERLRYLIRKLRKGGGGDMSKISQNEDGELAPELIEKVYRLAETNQRAHRRYVPRPYAGNAVLIRARESMLCFGDGGWKDMILGGLEIREVPGDHGSVLKEPSVAKLAHEVESCLQPRVDESSSSGQTRKVRSGIGNLIMAEICSRTLELF